jgi:two-component sensor histidine kinase
MSAPDRSGRTLTLAIAALVLATFGFIGWSAYALRERRMEMGGLSLKRTQQILHVRLDGMFNEFREDLREEAAALHQPDSLLVVGRWLPLLATHWPIMAIRLADEQGNESALIREDSTYLYQRTAAGSKDGPPIMLRYSGRPGAPPVEGPWLGSDDEDPRERVWFSKALESSRDEPSWTLRLGDTSGKPSLQISYLVRGRGDHTSYRVLAFLIDLSRADWIDTHSAAFLRSGIWLMDEEGHPLGDLNDPTAPMLVNASEAARQKWHELKTSMPYSVVVDGTEFRSLVGTYALNGQQLKTGVAVDLATLNDWLRPERRTLWVLGTLWVALATLLIAAWSRKRSSDERIRKQAKRNRSQEMKLAKALGEREVLNREVHHRVKNNLQVVSSLLNLQAMRLDEGAVKNEFLRGKRRIDTIALVHHKLYGLADLRNVDLHLFFTDLVKALAEMYGPNSRTVSTEVDTQSTKADQDTAIELGIILCELVSNTYLHAFPYATGGHVEIRVRAVEGDLYRLTVKDNGKGIPEGGHEGAGKLGLEIVEALAEQLDGSFHMRTSGGVLFEVLFRMQRTVATTSELEKPN